MRKRLFSFQASLFFCLLCSLSNATSQSPITVTHVVAPVNQLTISDIDFRNSTTPKWLFTINIAIAGGLNLDVEMRVVAGFSLPNEDYPQALRIATERFTVPGTRSISNLDFDRGIRLKLGNEGYSLRPEAKRRLEETALPTGQIPAGTYTFNVVVTAVDGSASGGTSFTIVLTNPSTVELISPIDEDPFAPQFPLFQWLYDGPSSRISIYEKLPGQTSLEEAASGVPHYTTVVTTNSLLYPSSGARILEPGKTYVWFVDGQVGAAGGTSQTRKSALRSFTVSSNAAQSLSALLDELARTLPQYQALFDELKSQGFTTASTILLNGSAISMSDLQKLLNKLRQNPDAVTAAGLE